jgi:hypothetical protein
VRGLTAKQRWLTARRAAPKNPFWQGYGDFTLSRKRSAS